MASLLLQSLFDREPIQSLDLSFVFSECCLLFCAQPFAGNFERRFSLTRSLRRVLLLGLEQTSICHCVHSMTFSPASCAEELQTKRHIGLDLEFFRDDFLPEAKDLRLRSQFFGTAKQGFPSQAFVQSNAKAGWGERPSFLSFGHRSRG